MSPAKEERKAGETKCLASLRRQVLLHWASVPLPTQLHSNKQAERHRWHALPSFWYVSLTCTTHTAHVNVDDDTPPPSAIAEAECAAELPETNRQFHAQLALKLTSMRRHIHAIVELKRRTTTKKNVWPLLRCAVCLLFQTGAQRVVWKWCPTREKTCQQPSKLTKAARPEAQCGFYRCTFLLWIANCHYNLPAIHPPLSLLKWGLLAHRNYSFYLEFTLNNPTLLHSLLAWPMPTVCSLYVYHYLPVSSHGKT